MKKLLILALVLIFSTALIQGCGDDSSDDSQGLQDLIDETPDGGGGGDGGGNVEPPGTLGELVDLGDLAEPNGDHWYLTQARALNDSGIVVGTSNGGDSQAGAFKWDPDTGDMTALGTHRSRFPLFGPYEDFFNQMDDPDPLARFLIFSDAVDINNDEWIIGNSYTGIGDETRGFLWKNGMFIDLPPIPADVILADNIAKGEATIVSFSEAKDINEQGEIVLTMEDGLPGDRHAYYWNGVTMVPYTLVKEDGTTFDILAPAYIGLSTIVGEPSDAVAINESLQAVMNSGNTAIYVDLNGLFAEVFYGRISEALGGLPGATFTRAVDINDSAFSNADGIPDGHIIGNSGSFSEADMNAVLNESFLGAAESIALGDAGLTDVQGFFWDGGAMYPIDHLGGGASLAADLNNQDQVVGGALTAEGNTHAFLWTLGPDEKGIIQDLGTLGGDNSMALAINEAGQVVGWSETGNFYMEEGVILPIRHGFLWDNGTMYDLGTHDYFYDFAFTPPYPFSEAVDINEVGGLTGNSITINAHPRGFYLNPVFP